MLSDVDIEALVIDGRLIIDPFDLKMLRPSSYVLRLGSSLLVLNDAATEVDVTKGNLEDIYFRRESDSGTVVINPGEFCLAASVETLSLPASHAGLLSLGSRVARTGISANNGSFLVHANHGSAAAGAITFELTNLTSRPIKLRAGMPFCHLILMRHESSSSRTVNTPGLAGSGPKAPRFHNDD